MMIKQLLLVLIVFGFISCNHQSDSVLKQNPITNYKPVYFPTDENTPLEKANLLGPIKQITTYKDYVNASSFEAVKGQNLAMSTSYNEEGKPTEQIFNMNDSSKQLSSYDYKQGENKILMTTSIQLENEKVKTDGIIHLVDDRMVASNWQTNTNKKGSSEFTYYPNGKIHTETIINDGDTTTSVYEYNYDDNERLIEKIKTFKSSYVIEKDTTRFEYDSEGKLIQKEKTHPVSGTFTMKYTYDNEGYLTTTDFFKNGVLTKSYSYDRFYNEIEQHFYKNNTLSTIRKMDYLFDTHGNWIEKRVSKKHMANGEDVFKADYIEFRKILYYE